MSPSYIIYLNCFELYKNRYLQLICHIITARPEDEVKKRGVIAIFCLIVILMSFPADPITGQDMPSRPRLGLALSGGGAKGLAHLGVIKVMEEAGLRPDYITGVSMGSIIGVMYAMGYSPDSIASMFRTFDWDAALSDRIDENKVIFLEKKHYYNSLISLPITREKIVIPTGLINGQQIESGLNYYLWPALRINDFSRLPVPFLCIGTDLITGKKVDLDHGYLPEAIRASIAIPSIFTPVRIDTALLVDGGVVRNYAVSELRKMGADIVIGSYVSFRGITEEDLESVYGILKQIGLLTSFADYEEQKRITDIMIEPDLKGVSTLSFTNIDSIINKGYRDALPYLDQFIRLADSLNTFGQQHPVEPLPDIEYYRFDTIEVKGNHNISDDQITGVLDIKPGEETGRDLLAERIELLYGKTWFEKVQYKVLPRNDSMILEIDCIERPRAMLYGSLHYDEALGAGVVFNVSVRDLLTSRSVINVDSYIGEFYRARFSAIQFIDRSQKFGVEASFFADNTRLPLIQLRDETGPMLSQNFVTGLTIRNRISLNHLMRLSGSIENQRLIPDYITGTKIKRLSYDYFRIAFSYEANTLNYKHFPDRGILYSLSASASQLLRGIVKTDSSRETYFRGDESPFSFDRFYTARAWFRTYTSPSDRVTLNFGGDLLLTTHVDSVTSNNNLFFLGGIEAVTDHSLGAVGFHANQVAVKDLAGFRFGSDVEILDNLHLTADANIFAIQEPDRDYGIGLIAGYGIGLGYMTVAGPIRIGLMHGLYSKQLFYKQVKGYINIGFSF
jgi:NTE family protein